MARLTSSKANSKQFRMPVVLFEDRRAAYGSNDNGNGDVRMAASFSPWADDDDPNARNYSIAFERSDIAGFLNHVLNPSYSMGSFIDGGSKSDAIFKDILAEGGVSEPGRNPRQHRI